MDWLTSKRVVCSIKEGVSSHRREASFTSRKRPLQLEKGVPFFLPFRSLLTRYCLVTLKLYDTEPFSKQPFHIELIIILNCEL